MKILAWILLFWERFHLSGFFCWEQENPYLALFVLLEQLVPDQ